jgi:hypothetical protein
MPYFPRATYFAADTPSFPSLGSGTGLGMAERDLEDVPALVESTASAAASAAP